MLTPPWIIEEVEKNERARERERLRIEVPYEEAQPVPSEPDDVPVRRGVRVLDISPASEFSIDI
jgi:hypothetical protein